MSALGMQNASNVDLSVDEIISQLITDNFYEFGKIMPLVSDMSALVTKGMKAIKFDALSDFEAQDQTFPLTEPGVVPASLGGGNDPDGNAITCQSLVLTEDVLALNKKATLAVSYDPVDLMQSIINWETTYQDKVIQSMIRKQEIALLAEISNVAVANQVDTAVAGELKEADLIGLVTLLHGHNIPENDRVMLVHPATWGKMIGLDCFLKADASGSDQALRQAQIGTVFGAPVIWDNAVPVDKVYYFHKDHVRYARQGDISTLNAEKPKQGKKETSWTSAYGCKVMKGGVRGAVLTLI